MGLLSPVIMGVLGREQRAAGLDATGLANLLTGQREEITAAMPAGLSKLLEGSGVRERIASSSAVERPPFEAPGTAAYATATQRPRTSTVSWPYWVLPLLALAGVLWYLLGRDRGTVETATAPKSTTEPVVRDVPNKIAYLSTAPETWVSIGSAPNEYVNKDIYNRAGEQLGTIKDVLVGPDGKMSAAIINIGRYLGIGDKEIAVPFSAIQQQRDGSPRIVIDATKDGLQTAPVFVRRQPSK
jgi:sporulation protein YlmC with PRC-barrel domain